MTRLRIVTINTGKGDGAYARRIGWLSDELRRLDPDIVLLQEALATPDGALGTTAWQAAELRMAVAFAPARRKPRAVEGVWLDTWSGLGLLSRFDAFRMETLPLPDHPDDGERIALVGQWVIGGTDLVIANVHLTHLRNQDELRGRQVAAVLAHPWLGGVGGVTLIGGDLNIRPAGLGWFREVAAPRRLTDAYEAGGGSPDRTTVPVGRPGVAGSRVDHLLAVEREADAAVRFTGARIVLDRADPDGIFPSDHYGVMVDLHLDDAIERHNKGERSD